MKHVARESLQTLAAQAVAFLLDLTTLILASRLLGPEGRGQYVFVVLSTGLLVFACSPGLTLSLVYHASVRSNEREPLLATAVGSAALFGGAGFLVGTLVSSAPWIQALLAHNGLTPLYMLLGFVAVPPYLLFQNTSALLRGWGKVSLYNILQIARPAFVLAALLVCLVGLRWGVAGAIGASVAGMGLTALLAFGLATRLQPWRPRRFAWGLLRDMVRYGKHAYVWNLAGFAEQRAAMFITSALLGPSALGLLSAAAGVVERLRDLADVMTTVLFPRVARAADPSDYSLSASVIRQVSFALIVLAVLLAVGAPVLVGMLFGSAFSGSSVLLMILAPGMAARALGRLLAFDLGARGKPQVGARASLASAVLAIAFAPLAIAMGGLTGAAAAMALVFLISFGIVFHAYRAASQLGSRALLLPYAREVRRYPAVLASLIRRGDDAQSDPDSFAAL